MLFIIALLLITSVILVHSGSPVLGRSYDYNVIETTEIMTSCLDRIKLLSTVLPVLAHIFEIGVPNTLDCYEVYYLKIDDRICGFKLFL